jgi:two-component system sensor histidine kinase KdpD
MITPTPAADSPNSSSPLPTWQACGLALLACMAVTAVSWPLHGRLDAANIVMLYLGMVVLVAARLGRAAAILASFLSVGLFDFVHVPPQWSFAVSNVQYLLTFAVMLGVALLISQLTTGLQQRAEQARLLARRAEALSGLARKLAGALSTEQVLEATEDFMRGQLQADLVILRPDDQHTLHPLGQPSARLTPTVMLAAHSVYLDQHAVHNSQLGAHDEAMVLLPLQGATRSRGVMIVVDSSGHRMRLQDQRPLLDASALLVATSLERLHFVDVAQRTQLDMASERLRSAILQALSHDIRTPLTVLYGLADSLTLSQPPLPEQARDTAESMRDQAMRLHRMVSNLLDMARLQSGQEAGQVRLRREWQPIEEVIGASIQHLGLALSAHPVRVHLPPDLPLLSIDTVLMERVFGNLLENAAKYAPPHTEVHLHAACEGGVLVVRVRNEGTGFPPKRLDEVFGLFERGTTESNVPGIGLGLAICRAIVQAHGGEISASNPREGGAEVRFTLPLGTPPLVEPEHPDDIDKPMPPLTSTQRLTT